MKLAVADDRCFFYPDVFVTCSQADRKDPLIQREPTLIVEVLSLSTAGYDLGKKFAYYRQIGSLREVAFIDLDMRRTDVYRKGADALWVLHSFGRGADVSLASVDLTMTAATLFADVDEEAPASQ
jgi:Uma2 family endonuclease